MVADILDCWIKVRRRRMIDAKIAQKKLEQIQQEVIKLHKARSEMAAYDSSSDSEDDWEEASDDEEEQYAMHGRAVSR